MTKSIKIGLLVFSILVSNQSLSDNLSLDFVKHEIKLAHNQYLKGSTESGLYALEALSRILESTDTSEALGPNSLSFTYLRVGLLHEKLGNETNASKAFNKALKHYKGSNASIAQLKEYVLRLDKVVAQ